MQPCLKRYEDALSNNCRQGERGNYTSIANARHGEREVL